MRRASDLVVWQSKRATLEAKREAALNLTRSDMTLEGAERVLGKGIATRFHGASFDFTDPANLKQDVRDFWTYRYKFAKGDIVLDFDDSGEPPKRDSRIKTIFVSRKISI